MKQIIFLSLTEKAQSYRIFYRQIYFLLLNGVKVYYYGIDSSSVCKDMLPNYTILKKKASSSLNMFLEFVNIVRNIHPDYIQAVNAYELPFAILAAKLTKTKLIYDCREDYFNQQFEYSNHSLRGFIKGSIFLLNELIASKMASAILTTDDYLLNKFSKGIFKTKRAISLRNFANTSIIYKRCHAPKKDVMHLVSIGGISKVRGIFQVCKYTQMYNRESYNKKIFFHIYGHYSDALTGYLINPYIKFHGYLQHDTLLKEITKYNVGITLWMPIKKFIRNLPMKNFEYMAIGMPVITSNFGNLKLYIQKANAGLCIDPSSYKEFKIAINKLFNIEIWNSFSNNCIDATKNLYNLHKELVNYLKLFK